jgi:hypothetical protein
MANDQPPEPSGPIEGRWERIQRRGYSRTDIHVDRPCRPFVASEGQQERCRENRGGDFYTACTQCVTCDAPHAVAPGLIAYVVHPESGGGVGHCIFTRQPRTPEEIGWAINAMCVSEVCGIRYGGRDPLILKRIAARGPDALAAVDTPRAGGA